MNVEYIHIYNREGAVKMARGEVGYGIHQESVEPIEIISITDAGDKDIPEFPEHHKVHRFAFNDFEFKGRLRESKGGLFIAEACGDVQNSGPSEEIAQAIADVIKNISHRVVMVHCEHGQSRSTAVGAALALVYNANVLCASSVTTPNRLLAQMLDDCLGLDGALIKEAQVWREQSEFQNAGYDDEPV